MVRGEDIEDSSSSPYLSFTSEFDEAMYLGGRKFDVASYSCLRWRFRVVDEYEHGHDWSRRVWSVLGGRSICFYEPIDYTLILQSNNHRLFSSFNLLTWRDNICGEERELRLRRTIVWYHSSARFKGTRDDWSRRMKNLMFFFRWETLKTVLAADSSPSPPSKRLISESTNCLPITYDDNHQQAA